MKTLILFLFMAAAAFAQPASSITINQTRAQGGVNGNCLKVNANGTVGQVTGCSGGGGAGTVTSVTGTANEIGVVNPTTTPVVSIVTSAALPGSPTTTTQSVGDATTKVSTTSYVATAIAALNPAVSVEAATTGVLSNTPTYNNGTAGVGATLTAGSFGVLTVDGYTPLINEPILVKNQASTFQNGVYTLTTVGTGSVAYVLTRRTDYNTPTNINYTGTIPVINGSTNGNTGWNLNVQVANIGTDPITYTQAAAGSSGGPPGGNVKAKGNLCNNSIITGNGGKTIQSADCNATMDSSGNIVTDGSLSAGQGGTNAGVVAIAGGTQTLAVAPANSTGWIGPTSVTGQHFYQPPGVASAAHQVMIWGAESSAVGIAAFKTIVDCQDNNGNHLNFTQSTDAFSCGTTSSGAAASLTYCADATGSTTTYTCTPSPALSAYATGQLITFVPQTTNTGASTVAISGLAATPIIAANTTGSALVAADLLAGGVYTLEFDGTNFRKINGPDGAWTALPTYQNGWTDFGSGFQAGQYKKDSRGTVWIRGTIKAGTTTFGTLLWTMPAGYRPPALIGAIFLGAKSTNDGIGRINVQTDGQVLMDSTPVVDASGFVTLQGISYSVY